MAREVVIRCERHPDRRGEEVKLVLPEGQGAADLCEECRAPLVEILALGRPALVDTTGPRRPVSTTERVLTSRIRGVPALD